LATYRTETENQKPVKINSQKKTVTLNYGLKTKPYTKWWPMYDQKMQILPPPKNNTVIFGLCAGGLCY